MYNSAHKGGEQKDDDSNKKYKSEKSGLFTDDSLAQEDAIHGEESDLISDKSSEILS